MPIEEMEPWAQSAFKGFKCASLPMTAVTHFAASSRGSHATREGHLA